ncbi:MAG: hypothetical protein WCR06_00315 [bacterium]
MRLFARIPWLLLLLLLVAAAFSIRPISDTDVLWHLRTGQWMLAHGDVIRQDVFSAMRLGCEWVSVPWLYQVMLAKLHAALGWGGLTLWQVGMVLGITLQTAFLVWLLRRGANRDGALRAEPDFGGHNGRREAVPNGERWNWRWPFLTVPAVLAVLLMLRLLQMRINCRPELNSYLFLGSFLIILTLAAKSVEARGQKSEVSDHGGKLARHATRDTRHILWLLPLLQVLWTNSHGAFLFGPVLVWAYAGAAWLGWLAGWWQGRAHHPVDPHGLAPQSEMPISRLATGPAPVRLSVVAILTTLACLATPYGLAGTFYPFHLFSVLIDPIYKNGVVEGQPVSFATVLGSGSLGYAFLACWVFAGLGLLGRLLEGVRAEHPTLNTEHSTSKFSCVIQFRCWVLDVGCWMFTSSLSLGYLVSCAAMAYLSLTAIRNVPLLPLVVAPLVANGIEYVADGFAALLGQMYFFLRRTRVPSGRAGPPDPPQQLDRGKPATYGACSARALPAETGIALLHSRAAHSLAQVLLALALVCFYRSIVSEQFYASLGWRMRFAIGYSDHEHPLAAANFIAQHRNEITCRTLYGDTRSANLFLARFGPEWPVYFDGRHAEIYPPSSFCTAARTRWDTALFTREADTYGIGLVCFSLTDLKEDRSPLAVALGKTNSWRLVYLDDCAAVFAAQTPPLADFVARYGLPCAPTNAAQQRLLFADWLARQGRADLAALYDPANRALEEGLLAGGIVNALQLNGLWAPSRRLEPLRFCRLAAFVDNLGWTVVADDLYQQTRRWPESFPVTLPRAIRHAQATYQTVSNLVLQAEMRTRLSSRARELQGLDPENPTAAAALLWLSTNAPAGPR